MLDNTTKKRIDDCRDILVGKLPDPKAQIEQITIGLIYKFMDDMDKENIELGGDATFFSGEYEKYSWDKLFDTKTTATQLFDLYSEAIDSMSKNPNIPPLFRDIFKNAYLPYRDPETLKMFLKTIAEFEYSNSEKLGDAFEYLLSVMGSQGDAGQFRTPRHIIDFLVAAVNPSKNDTILDPACGTAGFLISAYKHIKQKNKTGFTTDEQKKLGKNLVGYDISPDMVRLSLVNLFLHNFTTPQIAEYDTLSSEDKWNENFDVILANPPFMSPKGGIRPHNKFSISSTRSEVLFVDYIVEHLNPKGRAGIIIPEGIIFKNDKSYKATRKMLVENSLYAVVSLPAGVFQPYSGVKTSILLLDKELSKTKDEILFLKIENDGYNLGSQRNPIKGSQLEEAITILNDFRDGKVEENTLSHAVEKTKIAEKGDYNLSGERYLERNQFSTNYDKVKLADVLDYEQPTKYIVESTEYNDSYKTHVLTAGKSFVLGYTNETEGIFKENLPVIIFDDFTTATKFVDFPFKVKSSAMKILKAKENVNIYFLYHLMQQIEFDSSDHKRYWISQYSQLEIPLPPLSIQEEIVKEIESYQTIIDGAKMIVENYKPIISVDEKWDVVELEKVLDEKKYSMKSGPFGSSLKKEFYVESGYKIYGQEQVIADDLTIGNYYVNEEKYQELKNCAIKSNDILISLVGTIGKVTIVPQIFEEGIINPRLIKITLNDKKMLTNYFKYYFQSDAMIEQMKSSAGGGTMPVLNGRILKSLYFPLPPLEIQQEIVSKIEKEQALVSSNEELIVLFEQKIKDRIAKVWGE